MTLQDKAIQVSLRLYEHHQVRKSMAFDPMLVLVIVSILYNLIKLFIICGFSPAEAIDKAINPGILGRIRLRWVIKGEINGTPYSHLYHEIKNSLRECAEKWTESDMKEFYQMEAKGSLKPGLV